MSISFICTCGKEYTVSDNFAGKSATCKACGKVVRIPTPKTSTKAHTAQPLPEVLPYNSAVPTAITSSKPNKCFRANSDSSNLLTEVKESLQNINLVIPDYVLIGILLLSVGALLILPWYGFTDAYDAFQPIAYTLLCGSSLYGIKRICCLSPKQLVISAAIILVFILGSQLGLPSIIFQIAVYVGCALYFLLNIRKFSAKRLMVSAAAVIILIAISQLINYGDISDILLALAIPSALIYAGAVISKTALHRRVKISSIIFVAFLSFWAIPFILQYPGEYARLHSSHPNSYEKEAINQMITTKGASCRTRKDAMHSAIYCASNPRIGDKVCLDYIHDYMKIMKDEYDNGTDLRHEAAEILSCVDSVLTDERYSGSDKGTQLISGAPPSL